LARAKLIECLAGQRYAKLKDRFARALGRGPSRAARKAAAGTTIAAAAVRCIGKQLKRVRREGRAITDESPASSLHGLRIQCKRLRYLFELLQPVYGKSLKPAIKRLRSLQTVLGDFQDAQVATQRLRAFAEQAPARAASRGLLLALGQLISAQQQHAAAHRQAFRKAWKKFDRGVSRKKLIKMLGEPQAEKAPPAAAAMAPAIEQPP
jgi:CHAD domain-containing protein